MQSMMLYSLDGDESVMIGLLVLLYHIIILPLRTVFVADN